MKRIFQKSFCTNERHRTKLPVDAEEGGSRQRRLPLAFPPLGAGGDGEGGDRAGGRAGLAPHTLDENGPSHTCWCGVPLSEKHK